MKVVHINRAKIKKEQQAKEAVNVLHSQMEQLYRRRITKKYHEANRGSTT